MGSVLGLLSAGVYGVADYFGGMSAKRAPALAVVFVSQLIGVPVLLAVTPFFGGQDIGRAVAVGALAGLAGGGGVVLLYRALSVGTMSVIAPITGTLAAGWPVVWGTAIGGERPDQPALVGIGLVLVAIVAISGAGGTESAAPGVAPTPRLRDRWPTMTVAVDRARDNPSVPLAIAAGTCFGLFFIGLDSAGDDPGMWPLVGSRLGSLSLVGSLALLRPGRQLWVPRSTIPTVAAAGILDMTANALYVVAVGLGDLSIIATLSSLYPASTILLARVVNGEHMTRLQNVGLAVAAVAVVLIA